MSSPPLLWLPAVPGFPAVLDHLSLRTHPAARSNQSDRHDPESHTDTHRYSHVYFQCVIVYEMTYLLSFLAWISLQSCQSSGSLHTCDEIISLTSYYWSEHEEWLLKRYHRPRGSRLTWGSVQPLFSLQQRENVTFTFITSTFTSIWQETSAPGQQGAVSDSAEHMISLLSFTFGSFYRVFGSVWQDFIRIDLKREVFSRCFCKSVVKVK